MPARNIYAQGDLDGACFLYGIVNAFVALRRGEPEFGAVCAAFAQVDFPGDFLNAWVGTTGSYDKNYARLEENIARILSILGGDAFVVRRIAGDCPGDVLEGLISQNSVALVRYMGSSKHAADMDHWVCAVDYDRARRETHVACSVRRQRACAGPSCQYAETFHETYGRWSNDSLLEGRGHTIVAGEVFQISLKP